MSSRYNILLIISEDNGQHIGCYGDPYAQTPHIDKLASEGVRFENMYATQAVCSPGRASILTGLYPHQNGQFGLATHKYALYDEFPNMPRLLKNEGYRTGLIGKLHINPEDAFPYDLRWNPKEFISFANRDVRKMAEVAGEFMKPSDEPFFLQISFPRRAPAIPPPTIRRTRAPAGRQRCRNAPICRYRHSSSPRGNSGLLQLHVQIGHRHRTGLRTTERTGKNRKYTGHFYDRSRCPVFTGKNIDLRGRFAYPAHRAMPQYWP